MPTEMPTAAKGMAAATFAVAGWLTANVYVPNMPDVQAVGSFRELTGVLGAIVGWSVMGKSVGKGYLRSIGAGWKTMIVLVFFGLLLFGIYEMLLKSVKMHYDGAFEAFLDVFMQMLKRAPPLWTTEVFSTMVISSGIAGLMAEFANRRWR
jgi:hypothetical protein